MDLEFARAAFVALLGVGAFAAVLIRTGIVDVASGLAQVATGGVSAMLDGTLDDRAKERAVRRAGLDLIKGAWQILWRFVLALAGLALPILVADLTKLVPRDISLAVLIRVDFLVGVSIAAVIVWWLLRRRNPTEAVAVVTGPSVGDRMIHILAFSGRRTFRWLAWIDDRFFSRCIAAIPDQPPIFITSLARGGTTALLNALHSHPGVATHLYRDMPLIAAPLVWSRLTGRGRNVADRERAHGDGIRIGLGSPEAFDEVFWMQFWPEKYHPHEIELWRASDAGREAPAFFLRHFRKIVALRRPGAQGPVRYLSKNNANIARIALLPEMFPGAAIVVPLRHPAAQAASLLRQHRRFTTLHANDDFALRYMRDIGHFEFGALHRPIAFEPGATGKGTPDEPDYWLRYWIAAMSEVGRHREGLIFVTQDDLRSAPDRTLRALTARLGLDPVENAATFFRPEPDIPPDELFDAALLSEALAIYRDLEGSAVR